MLGSVLIATLLLAGCSDTKSVDWWRNHPQEAAKKVNECKQSGSDSENCKNVKEAVFHNQQQNAPVPEFN